MKPLLLQGKQSKHNAEKWLTWGNLISPLKASLYTKPSLLKQFGPPLILEPQYIFVREIERDLKESEN